MAAVPPELLGLSSAPNPFRSRTVVQYTTSTPGPVELAVYDAAGRLVRRMVSVDAIGAAGDGADWRGADGVGGDVVGADRVGADLVAANGGGIDGIFAWDGQTRTGVAVPPGVYFARVTTPGGTASIRIVRIE